MLNEVVRQNKLEDRVQLLGAVKNDQVRNVLIKGDIFLNSSLTEAFCIAIVEAVSCGLQVVTTNVGGIPEVLPSDLIWLGEPTVEGLVGALERAIKDRELGNTVCPLEAHNRIRKYYQWPDIAKRTEVIYDSLIDHHEFKPTNNRERFKLTDNDNPVNYLINISDDECSNENDFNQLNKLNNQKLNSNHRNILNENDLINNSIGNNKKTSLTKNNYQIAKNTKKVLYENELQLIDLDYLKNNQDKTGLKHFIKQSMNNNNWFFGLFLLFLLSIEYLMKVFYDLWNPKSQIDICPSTKILNRTNRLTKIRNNKSENKCSVLKVNKHQFTKSCYNCNKYVQPLEKDNLTSDRDLPIRIRQYLHNQLNNNASLSCSFNLKNYMNSSDLLKSTTNSTTNCGLKTIELMNYKLFENENQQILNQQNHSQKEQIINQCQKLKQDKYKSTNSIEDDEAMSEQSTDLTEESVESIDFNRQTFDDDEYEQEKNSRTEITSGYNTSNSLDSDNNSTSSNLDLGESSSSNFDQSNEQIDDQLIDNQILTDSTKQIYTKDQKLIRNSHQTKPNESIDVTNNELASLLSSNEQFDEEFDKSDLNNDNKFHLYSYRCDDCLKIRRRNILIKN